MSKKYLTTSQVAKAVGVHPNTVRMYEEWGLLPPIPRKSNGYRQFTEFHIDQMRLARFALHSTFLSGEIRKTALAIIKLGAAQELAAAYEQALYHRRLIQAERDKAEEAVIVLEEWVKSLAVEKKSVAKQKIDDGFAQGGAESVDYVEGTGELDEVSSIDEESGECRDSRDGRESEVGLDKVPKVFTRSEFKQALRIKEVSRLLDTSVDILRNWERDGLIVVPRDSATGYRAYSEGELSRLKVIRALRRARYSMMAVLRMLQTLDGGDTQNLREKLDTPEEDDIVYATDHWLSTLTELEQRSEEMVAYLELMLKKEY